MNGLYYYQQQMEIVYENLRFRLGIVRMEMGSDALFLFPGFGTVPHR